MDEQALAPFLSRPEKAGLFLDFDGTLSRIVPTPAQARPVEGAPALLDGLGRRFGVVAVVSGRPAGQLLEWFGDGIELWGLHGAEHTSDGKVVVSERVLPFVELMERVKEEAEARIVATGLGGVLVEDKGVMVGLHYREATDQATAAAAVADVAEQLAASHGVLVAKGRKAFEIRPPVPVSKAEVVAARATEAALSAVAFAGDDTVDLPAFDSLDELAERGVQSLRVAVNSDEAPAELLDRADVVVDGPEGVLGLLRRLLGDPPA